MFDFHEKRKIRNIVFSKFTILILLILTILLSMSVFERFMALRAIAEKRAIREAELHELRQRAAALEAEVEYLQHGRGIEEELRNRFDVAKEGEQVIIIVDDEKGQETSIKKLEQSDADSASTSSFWSFFTFW